jgi:gluconate 5-dehydrogenase
MKLFDGTYDTKQLQKLFDLTGQTVLVIGAASGLGQAVAIGAAVHGANLMLADIDQAALDATRQELQKVNPSVAAIEVDVSQPESVQRMAKAAVERFGSIDASFQLPAISIKKPALELTPEQFDQVMDLNVNGVFHCLREIGGIMVRQRHGKLINFASIFSTVALPQRAAYSASKGAVAQLTKALALEWAPYNVQVNALAPAHFKTPMTKNLWGNPDNAQEIIERNPQRRFAETYEIIGPALFLASPASSFMTGTTVYVDGGWTAQ